MYLEFYGLKEPPFSITPDPRFVFLSERHRDALAHLLYGVGKGGSGGFVQLTGEVGTGKTTLSRLLLEQLPEHTRIALVLNPKLSPVELLETIGEELKLDIAAVRGSLKGLIDALNHFLLDAYAQGLRIVLIIDEAQNLSSDALEQVRLLTNLETPTQKLLQIILLGQPELRQQLERPELRQLAQRITARYHLTPLDENETEAYLRHRMGVAGAARFAFTRLAVRALFQRAGGVPRLINIIADRALMAGYVADEIAISERLVEHAADEVLGGRARARRRYATLGAALVIMLGAAWWLARVPPPRAEPRVPAAPAASVPAPPPPGVEALDAALAALPRDAELVAWTHLLALWRVDPGQVVVRDAARCPSQVESGLSCLRTSGNLAKLRMLDRPVLLALHRDGRTHVALLTGVDAARARLDFGPHALTVSLDALEERWRGEFTALWRVPLPIATHLHRGDAGGAVNWVRQQLGRFGTLADDDVGPALYDAALEARVRRVQSEFGLLPDGIVGPETELALASRDDGGPRLARRFD
jgi:general secretion pathway protein A